MNEQQARLLAEKIEREEPRFTALASHRIEWGKSFWVVELYVRATDEFRQFIEEESDWEELIQILKDRE